MLFGGHVKVNPFLYTQLIIWIDTILNHIDTKTIFPKYESYFFVYIPEWYEINMVFINHILRVHNLWNPYYKYQLVYKKQYQTTIAWDPTNSQVNTTFRHQAI